VKGGSKMKRKIALIAIPVVLAIALAGGPVFAWQQAKVRDGADALAAALRAGEDASREAVALKAKIEALAGQADALQAQVNRLRSKLSNEQQLDVSATAPCDAAVMLLVIQQEVPIGPPWVWESVNIQQCQNGYARVLARPLTPEGPGDDSEQVFLKDDGGTWHVLTSGTGIACSDPDIGPELEEACKALGLAS
jgi:hypothetical protein